MKKILIIDDEKDLCEILAEFCKKLGYIVQFITSHREVIDKIKSFIPDIIFLDIAIPEKDGISILKELKNDAIKCDVIMITAYRDADKIVQAFRLGAKDCVFKPFDFSYLKSLLAKL